MAKKNVTVVLSNESARWLRIEAARRDTSVSQYLGDLIERERARDQGYADAMQRFLSRRPVRLGAPGEALPMRAALHER